MKNQALWHRIAIVPIAIVLCFGSANARTVDAFKLLKPQRAIGVSAAIATKYYYLDSAVLASIISGHDHIQLTNFPGGVGDVITLDIKPAHSPIDATTQCVVGSSEGEKHIAAPPFVAFRGKVLGEPNSRVFLTVFSGNLLCSITRESGEVFVLGPSKNGTESGLHILTRETDLLATNGLTPLNCITEDILQPNAPIPVNELLARSRDGATDRTLATTTLLQTDIAVEADSCFYHAAGGTDALVLGYIASLFAMSSSIYEDEVNITWHLTWVKLWSSGDPYNVKGNAYGLEPLVPNYWKAHYANVPRDLAHVMTSIGYGGGGYGWYSLCDTNWSYSVSSPQTGHQYPTFAFTYDAYIVAHEIGHNFSLPHSHTCYWDPPLDTCWTKNDPVHGLSLGDACDSLPITPRRSPGTIMSYCANANYTLSGNDITQFKLAMTFSPKVDSVLRVNAEKAPCIQPPQDTTLILLSPRGSESYRGDTSVLIRWTFAHVDSVELEYSPNGGTSWVNIVSSLPAAVGQYAWKVPNVNSKSMLVRVVDEAKSDLDDTSLLFFAVTSSASVSSSAKPSNISISPDPAYGLLTISAAGCPQVPYEILDTRGVVIRSGVAPTGEAGSATINLENLPAGTYFLHITSSDAQVFPFIHVK